MCNTPALHPDTSRLQNAADGIPFGACTPLQGAGGLPVYIRGRCEAPTETASESSSLMLAIAIVVPCFLLWVLVFALALRYKRRTSTLAAARAMVLNQEDMTFGTPEPMRKGGRLAGGEIDPETGNVTLYQGADDSNT